MKSIRELVDEKKLLVTEAEDIEKIEVIEDLLSDESSFFSLDMETFFGILDFLNVPEDDMMEYYNTVLSFENFNKIPGVRMIDESIGLSK